MKTPKRYFSYPSDPNADMSDLYEQEPKQHARWKRKNREAQLKRTIARQKRVWKDYLDVIELYFGDEMNTMWWQDQEGS